MKGYKPKSISTINDIQQLKNIINNQNNYQFNEKTVSN